MPAERAFADEFKIALAARAAACVHFVLTSTNRLVVSGPTYADRRRLGEPVRCLYAAWHCHLWHAMEAIKGQGVHAMVSRHSDGEIIARVLARKGFKLLRGSSTRGGVQALRELVRAVRDDDGDMVVTVDGPRGPAGEVKEGIVYSASRTGLPIVPLAAWIEPCWRARSWDRMVIGKPFARVGVAMGDEILVPPDADRRALGGTWTRAVAAGLLATEERARALLHAAR